MKKSAILLGSKPGSVAALMLLINQDWEVKEVVASPDEVSWIPGPSLYEVSKSFGIRTVSKQQDIKSDDVDFVISYMHRSLVKECTLKRGKYSLNFHAGPLPEFGGWAFYNVAILDNSPEYGCTCHIMDQSFDTGPLVKVRRFSINPRKETAVSLENKTQVEMILLFRELIANYEIKGYVEAQSQDPSKMRYLNSGEFSHLKQIPETANAEEADKIARAFWYPPYEMAYYLLPNGTKVEVIPEIVKDELANEIHKSDLKRLMQTLCLSHQCLTFNY